MKTKGSLMSRLANWFIVALVIGGTVLVTGLAEPAGEATMMTVLFLGFLGAIIAIQVVPCVLLFGAMLKGIFGIIRGKEEAKGEVE